MTHVSDDFLSAHLDGEPLSTDDAAHVGHCDACQARLEQFRLVTSAVGAPVHPPAAHLREAALAIALDERNRPSGRVRSLTERRDMAKTATRRMSALSAAAALVVALGVGGWLLSQVGRDSDTNRAATANALQNRADESATAADALSGAGGTADAAGSTAGFFDVGEIGAFGDVAAVAAHYREWVAKSEEERAKNATVVTAGPCPDAPNQPTGWMATLTFDGEPAWARVVFVTAESSRLEVLRRTDCSVLATQAI